MPDALHWRNLALLVAVAAAAQPSLSVKDVMKRVERYVASYGEKASIVVCTERYEQTALGSGASERQRTLVSDLGFVHADAIRGWLGFRDVIEVDGHPIGDREDRLADVLMASQGRYDEARRLSDESARFNLGAIERNFNIPTAALFYFLPDNHDRFKFTAKTVAPDGTWEIAFREIETPTLIRTPDGDSIKSAGTIWVRPEDGVIVRTRLEVDTIAPRLNPPQHGAGFVDVTYRFVDDLAMWLPERMDEAFEARRQQIWDRVTGHADYSNYRRFTTSGRIKK
jgi:hypothetical protein